MIYLLIVLTHLNGSETIDAYSASSMASCHAVEKNVTHDARVSYSHCFTERDARQALSAAKAQVFAMTDPGCYTYSVNQHSIAPELVLLPNGAL